jgi:D-amino peptidase
VRVIISVDMEGIAGIVDGEDVRPGHHEYERNRHYMTAEANAAIRGVLAFDQAAEVLVSDAHASFRNLLPDELDRRAELLRGKPKPDGMISGVRGADAAIFIGYHGKAGTPGSVLSHTIHGGVLADVRIDGQSLGELGLNAAMAAAQGAIAVMVAGDDSVAAEAAKVVPGMRAVIVKRALGSGAAASLHPAEACDRIEAAVPAALEQRSGVRPPRFTGPVVLEADVFRPSMAEAPLLIPGVSLAGGRTLRYQAPDFATAYGVLTVITMLGGL